MPNLRHRPRPRRRHRGWRLGVGLLALPAGLLAGSASGAVAPSPAAATSAAPAPSDWLAAVERYKELKHNFGLTSDAPTERAVHSVADALSKCRASLSDEQRWRIADAIEQESRRHGYDPLFVQAMIEVESTCKPTARSPRGALGLIQVQPATAREVALEAGVRWRGAATLLDPELNVRLGLLYLAQLEERFGDVHLAIAAYNLGPNRVAGMTRDRARRSRYVRKVLARYEDLLADQAVARS